MNARECLHRWAQQNEVKGKSGNVFFEGKSCYSYGHHFEMARMEEMYLGNMDYSNALASKWAMLANQGGSR